MSNLNNTSESNEVTKTCTTKITVDSEGCITAVYNPAESYQDGAIPDSAITVSSEVATLMINSMQDKNKLTITEAQKQAEK